MKISKKNQSKFYLPVQILTFARGQRYRFGKVSPEQWARSLLALLAVSSSYQYFGTSFG